MSAFLAQALERIGLSRPVRARFFPFLVYVLFLAFEPLLAEVTGLDQRWLYAPRIGATMLVLSFYWQDLHELCESDPARSRNRLIAIVTGVVVLLLWINLDQGWVTLGGETGGFVPLDTQGERKIGLIAVRLFGAAIVVPIMEELFWRSLVQRWLDRAEFSAVNPRQGSLKALLITSLLFGFEHSQWLAGIIAGLAYGWLYRRSGKIWPPILAHGVTNFLLGCWVLYSGQWHFW